jgi:RNA polymerase sigma factor (sigma-70 family)
VTDAVLIARVLTDDDPQAFDELVERYQSPVRALLLRLTRSNQSLSDELAQDTFLQAYRSLRSFKGDARFSTWLHSIAYRAFLVHIRSQRATEQYEDDLHGTAIEPCTRTSDFNHDLELAMQSLSLPERAVLTLCLGDGCTHEEAATALNLPLGTVKTHASRGREKLKALLSEWQNA